MKGPESRLFGVSLDPSDDPLNLDLKRAWISRGRLIAGEAGCFLDPYDSLVPNYSPMLKALGIEPYGKFPVPSWLWPRPRFDDRFRVTAEKIAEFYDCGEFERLLQRLQEYVSTTIMPARPVMLGIDHSATYSAVSALSDRYGADNISLIVLDQHFDALSPRVRTAAAAPAFAGLSQSDHLNCGNFLARLLDEKRVKARNLSLIGVADYPAEDRADKPGSAFRRSYLKFQERGATFFPAGKFKGRYRPDLVEFAGRSVKTPYVYVSLDLDVASGKGVLASRYQDWPGLSEAALMRVAEAIKAACRQARAVLTGLDIMEFNQHFLGLEVQGAKDATLPLVDRYLRTLLG